MGAASRWWLHHSLASLEADLKAKGSRLILRRGRCEVVLAELAREADAATVHCLQHYEPVVARCRARGGRSAEFAAP